MAKVKKSAKGDALRAKLIKHYFEKLSNQWNHPPNDFVFVPKGDVYITRNWSRVNTTLVAPYLTLDSRDMTGRAGGTLYVVYDHRTGERLGVHCHSLILEAVNEDAAATAEYRHKVIAAKDSKDYTQNRKLLYRHFPELPAESATDILDHGFLKGSGRVGRAQTLDGKLRIALAVNAHIRHKLTNYDSILRASTADEQNPDPKRIARETVYDQVQAIADSWRKKIDVSESANIKTATKPTTMSTTMKSVTTLETNRSRRKLRAQKNLTAAESQASALEKALQGLQLDEGSVVKLSVNQQRKVAIREDLERLNLDPNHHLEDKRMAQVSELYRQNSGDVDSLGGVVEVQKAQVRARKEAKLKARKNGRNTKKAPGAANHRRLAVHPVGRDISEMSKGDQTLLQQFERHPDMPLKRRTRAKLMRLIEERRILGARAIHGTTFKKVDDGYQRRDVEVEGEVHRVDLSRMREGHDLTHTSSTKGRPKPAFEIPSTSRHGSWRANQISQGTVEDASTQSSGYKTAVFVGHDEENMLTNAAEDGRHPGDPEWMDIC